jgi:hypothetical protein
VGDGKRLPRASGTQQDLMAIATLEALDELTNGGRLIAGGFMRRDDLEGGHDEGAVSESSR